MTLYEIPTAPDVDTLWLRRAFTHVGAPGAERWTRAGTGTWQAEDSAVAHTWPELLSLGTVSDVHPDLPADDPLPWIWTADGIEDANADAVRLSHRVGPFIVKAVNAYGERVTNGGPSPVDALTATLQAELAEVLGEVRHLLNCASFDRKYIDAKDSLRARLDRA